MQENSGQVVAARLLITGRVQGVFYRAETARAAKREGVGGWVRNCRDGSVEAYVVGPEKAVKALIAWCRRGPPLAQVEDIVIKWMETPDNLRIFEIR